MIGRAGRRIKIRLHLRLPSSMSFPRGTYQAKRLAERPVAGACDPAAPQHALPACTRALAWIHIQLD